MNKKCGTLRKNVESLHKKNSNICETNQEHSIFYR
jgi:hypothetical protein